MLNRQELLAVIEVIENELNVPTSDKLTDKERAIVKKFNANLESALEKLQEELKY